jgi:hypothetical protein
MHSMCIKKFAVSHSQSYEDSSIKEEQEEVCVISPCSFLFYDGFGLNRRKFGNLSQNQEHPVQHVAGIRVR